MSYTPWLASLPQAPKRDGFQRSTMSALAIFQPEAGTAMRRLRHTAIGRLQNQVFELSGQQLEDFEEYFQETLGNGALPFLWQGPKDDAAHGWVFDSENPYTITPLGSDWWDLSVRIERLP